MNTPKRPEAGSRTARRELARSALWAAAITLALCIAGASASMAVAHSAGLLVLLFAPMFPVFLVFGEGGFLAGTPEWLFDTLAVVSQFAGVIMLVHPIRIRLRRWHAKP